MGIELFSDIQQAKLIKKIKINHNLSERRVQLIKIGDHYILQSYRFVINVRQYE